MIYPVLSKPVCYTRVRGWAGKGPAFSGTRGRLYDETTIIRNYFRVARDERFGYNGCRCMVMTTVGNMLKEQRERLGWTVDDVADRTNISVNFLQAIESNRFKVLPRGVFAKMFIKTYAKCVSLDQDEIVRLYYEQKSADEDITPAILKNVYAQPEHRPKNLLLPAAVLFVILCVMGVSAYYLFFHAKFFSTGASYPEGGSVGREGNTASAFDSGGEGGTPSEAAVREPVVGFQPGQLEVVIEAKDVCWIYIRWNESEEMQFVLKKGDPPFSRIFSGKVSLKLGNAGGVDLRLNGRLARPLGIAKEVVSVLVSPDDYEKYLVKPEEKR